MRTCVRMIFAVLLPRFSLLVALSGSRQELVGRPVALAPELGRAQFIGETSPAAEVHGVRAGMRLGEAMARCPQLVLVPPDPAGVADEWERVLAALESIGAAVEPGAPGAVCFDAAGLLGLHGGIDGVLRATRRALDRPARLAAAPSRFAALAAAARARARRPVVVHFAGPFLASLPIDLLSLDGRTAALVEPFERLGIRTLGELAALSRAKVADRFGAPGLTAWELARGGGDAPAPRRPMQRLRERLDLPESASGPALERALALLVDRLLARRERRGRSIRAAVLEATLVEGGTWRERTVFREALADAARMRLVLAPRLQALPAPAEALALAVERFGPPASDQPSLLQDSIAVRRSRLREAIRQARVAAGPEAALRVLEVEPGSRVPERRAVLTPFQ
jgi:nucleotidyltransferase/DNA polymerase involved in DNA repair